MLKQLSVAALLGLCLTCATSFHQGVQAQAPATQSTPAADLNENMNQGASAGAVNSTEAADPAQEAKPQEAQPKDEQYQKMLDSTVPANVELKNEPKATACDVCWEKGPFTKEHPVASQVLLFPARVVTAVIGLPVGAITGLSKGADYATARATEMTWAKIGNSKVKGSRTSKAFKYGPAGFVSNAVALPLGGAVGFIRGAGIGVAKGYMYPDKL